MFVLSQVCCVVCTDVFCWYICDVVCQIHVYACRMLVYASGCVCSWCCVRMHVNCVFRVRGCLFQVALRCLLIYDDGCTFRMIVCMNSICKYVVFVFVCEVAFRMYVCCVCSYARFFFCCRWWVFPTCVGELCGFVGMMACMCRRKVTLFFVFMCVFFLLGGI